MAAVDLGAQSGRVALGSFDGDRLSVVEVHRFPNVPVRTSGTLHWDVLRLYEEVLEGLTAVAGMATAVDSVGVDSWGVDFGLLDRDGRLVQNPVHHRDRRTDGAMEALFAEVPARDDLRAHRHSADADQHARPALRRCRGRRAVARDRRDASS